MPPASSEEKILSLKAQRTQLQGKLDDWENTHVSLHGRASTAADRQRSREHRELSRLLVDLDGFITSLEGGGSGAPHPHAPGTRDAERRAERGRTKAKMRRWERDFERKHNRRPTEAEVAASGEMSRLRTLLRGEQHGAAASSSVSGIEDAAPYGGGEEVLSVLPAATDTTDSVPAIRTSPSIEAEWTRGNEYNELLRSRVRSQSAVNGFAGVTHAEAHAAAESFAAWDLDHDGVLSRAEFGTILQFLSESPLDEDTLTRLFVLVDRDGSGEIDFNEWLAIFSQLGAPAVAVR